MDQVARRTVGRVEGVHGADHAQLVYDAPELGQELADLNATGATLTELERRRQQPSGHPLRAQVHRLRTLTRVAAESRLRVQHVHVGRSAGHEQEHEVLRARREVRTDRTAIGSPGKLLLQHTGQSYGTESPAQRAHQLPPGEACSQGDGVGHSNRV